MKIAHCAVCKQEVHFYQKDPPETVDCPHCGATDLIVREKEGQRKTVKPFDITKQCPHCDSTDIEYHNYEWFCNNCDEQWNQYGEDTK